MVAILTSRLARLPIRSVLTLTLALVVGLAGINAASAMDGGAAAPKPEVRQMAQASYGLSGNWWGRYYYEDGRAPVTFYLTLSDNAGRLFGRIREPNTFGASSAPYLYAHISGRRNGRFVSFSKTYDGTGGQRHTVYYSGTISANGRAISGRWRIRSTWSGNFTLYRR